MSDFPYFQILKNAYELTLKNRWMWVFGFFIGGTFVLNFGWLRYFFPAPAGKKDLDLAERQGELVLDWISQNPQIFTAIVVSILFLSLLLVLVNGISKAAVIWSVRELKTQKPAGLKTSLRASKKYFLQIITLQIIVSAAFFAFFLVFSSPIFYLFSAGAVGRALVLSILGLVIFVPASVVLGFLHLYGPIFIVLYHVPIAQALKLSFNLVRFKLKESIFLSAFLIGINLVFMFLVIFSIILLSFPLALFILVLAYLGFELAAAILLLGAAVLGFLYLLILSAGFAVFQNTVWVLAVDEMVKTRRLPEQAKAYATEPA